MGYNLICLFSSWGLLSNSIKQPLLRVCCRAIYYGGLWLTASVPLLGIGYGIVSGGHALSADLILAVFQTNPGEALSYLKEQPLFLWALSLLGIFAISILVISLSRKMLKAAPVQKPSIILILMALLALNMKSTLPRIKIFYLANTITSARTSLKAYEQYKIMKEIRLNRLSALPPLSIDSQARGTYVLVIGESASRDHMHVYGYDRQATPWMDKMAGCKGTTIFSYPYANYCQTILSLTYALSEKISTITFPLKKLIPSSILRKQLATIPTGSATRQDLVLQTRPLPSFPPPQHIILGSMEEAHPPVIPHTLMENLLQNFQIT